MLVTLDLAVKNYLYCTLRSLGKTDIVELSRIIKNQFIYSYSPHFVTSYM